MGHPSRLNGALATGAAFSLLGAAVGSLLGVRATLVLAFAVFAVLTLVALIVRISRNGESTQPEPATDRDQDRATADDPDADDTSVWDAIPSWQYGGRHVESGGLARGEQEQALEEIQEQAAEIERDRQS
ncbi:hypothetical protein OB905_05300 [Halobacteria archaeon AArc-dxtr1]|nr:hypothetical protein [Halobacteria archaeon AArc-dxtr1]